MSIGTNSILEGKVLENQREEDDSKCENVCFYYIILIFTIFCTLMYLWSHISFSCPFVLFRFYDFFFLLKTTSKAEVTDFEVLTSILIKNKYVLQFEVAVSDSLRMYISEPLNYTFKGLPFGVDFRLLFSKIGKKIPF